MRRVLFSVVMVTFVSAVAVTFGQPPTPPLPVPVPLPPPTNPTPPLALPPAVTGPTTPPVPTTLAAPAGWTTTVPSTRPASGGPPPESPLAAFEPLAAFPQTTQRAVRAVLLGSNWMLRMNQPHGRFIPGYRPALRQPTDGDHDMNQVCTALALAQAAKFAGDDRQATIASQAILSLLAVTRVDPADPDCRVPVASSLTCNRVGFAAVLALSIYDLPGADERLTAEAERLCGFLRKQFCPNGSIHCNDGPIEPTPKIDPTKVTEFPGYALQAIMASHRARPAAWKTEAVAKAVSHYRGWFKANPSPRLAATLTPGFADLARQAGSAEATTAVFEMNDWLISLQYPSTDPRHPMWLGGFRGWVNGQQTETEPGCECGAYLQSLAWAYELSRRGTDLTRAERYRQAAQDAAHFLTELQYTELNTRHFENTFRANVVIGGFHQSPTDGNLRVESSAWAVTGLLRFLTSGAERN
jgi:hypothetical protein